MAVFPNSIALPKTRAEIENLIEAAISALDSMEAEADLEPSIGWTTSEVNLARYSPYCDDLEANNSEDEGDLSPGYLSPADPEYSRLRFGPK